MEILGFAWWTLGLVVVGFLFSLILFSYLMCCYFRRAEAKVYGARTELEPNHLGYTPLEPTYMEADDLYAPVTLVRRSYAFWSALATRTYVMLAVACGGVYIFSRYPQAPPSPYWLGVVLTAFTFVSAFFTYKTWRRGREE